MNIRVRNLVRFDPVFFRSRTRSSAQEISEINVDESIASYFH